MDFKKLQKTRFPNLRRHIDTGIFYVFAKVNGKTLRKPLDTNKQEVALKKCSELILGQRSAPTRGGGGTISFGAMIDAVQERAEMSIKLLANTKRVRQTLTNAIKKYWPQTPATKNTPALSLDLDAARVTLDQLQAFSHHVYPNIWSADRYNHAVQQIDQGFQLLVERGYRLDNPAAKMERITTRYTCPPLPNSSEFEALLTALERGGHRDAQNAADFVRFLAWTGGRSNEANNVLWTDIDWEKEEITFRIVKNANRGAKPRTVPMLQQTTKASDGTITGVKYVKDFLLRLFQNRGDRLTVLPIKQAKNSITTACEALGLPRMTPHKFRHYFATVCIEAGTPVPVVAKWLGHRDGGALALKVYTHVRSEEEKRCAANISFVPTKPQEVQAAHPRLLWQAPAWARTRWVPTGTRGLVRVTATGEYACRMRAPGETPRVHPLGTWDETEALAKMEALKITKRNEVLTVVAAA